MKLDYAQASIVKENLCDQIADQIEQMILRDKAQAQQKLPSEQTLAMGFNVSRQVIREALMILKARGLIMPRQGGGSYITVPKSTQMMDVVNRLTLMRNISLEDVYAVRIQLEVMAARLCTERVTSEQLEQLAEVNREMEARKHDVESRADLDLKFHQKIASFSGNELLRIFVQSLNGILRPMLLQSLCLPMANEDGIEYHDRIIQTLQTGDPDASERIIREHLLLSIRNYEFVKEHADAQNIYAAEQKET